MLKTLTVWNFALLEHVEINFEAGLNILTGETGAGKSILIDALGAVLGHRLSADVIRTGCDWSRVEAIFDIAGEKELHALLREQAIDDEDDTLIITRQLTAKGKNVILVNGCHVTLAVLRTLGEFLADIHGQHENLALLRTANQFALLDGADPAIAPLLSAYRESYEDWQDKQQRLAEKRATAKDSADRLDMLRWQAQEIESAQLREGEDDELEADIKRLANAERITENLELAYGLLEGSGDNEGILAGIARVKQSLETISRFDESLTSSLPMLEDAACQLQEVFYSVRDYQDSLEFDPARLDRMQGRMDQIDRLRKKYGGTVRDVLDYQAKIAEELRGIENFDEDLAALEQAEAAAAREAGRRAEKLGAARRGAATKLSQALGEQLTALGMPDARLTFALQEGALTANGADDLTILFSANAGESERPLAKIASGGELSRLALAIKTVAATDGSAAGSMVFDEIDTGIGGQTAQMVADRIATVAAHKQVLCITHLPQIACMADGHFHLSKTTAEGKTATGVRRLQAKEQVREIARMASGADATAASLSNAQEMIRNAAARKKKLR